MAHQVLMGLQDMVIEDLLGALLMFFGLHPASIVVRGIAVAQDPTINRPSARFLCARSTVEVCQGTPHGRPVRGLEQVEDPGIVGLLLRVAGLPGGPILALVTLVLVTEQLPVFGNDLRARHIS